MPRIDPHQLLKTLGVLLAPSGGIKSNDEVIRLVTLMHKFSKKLVSKCIYVKILKATTQELLDRFLEVITYMNHHYIKSNEFNSRTVFGDDKCN